MRTRILEIEFERDRNSENDLRVRDFKWVDKWMSKQENEGNNNDGEIIKIR